METGAGGAAGTGMVDRRGRRDLMLRSGQIIFGDSVVNCVVQDMSPYGARVDFGAPVVVPEEVHLRMNDGTTYRALQRWSRGTQLGLRFAGPAEASGDQGHARRAFQALQALQAAAPAGCTEILRAERFFGDEELRQAVEAAEAAHARLAEVLRPHAARRADGSGAASAG